MSDAAKQAEKAVRLLNAGLRFVDVVPILQKISDKTSPRFQFLREYDSRRGTHWNYLATSVDGVDYRHRAEWFDCELTEEENQELRAHVAVVLTEWINEPKSNESDLRERALDCLTPAQRRIVERLEESRHFVCAGTLKESGGCFRKGAGTTDRAVASQIESIQTTWDEHEIPWSIKSRDNAEKPAYKLLK